MFLTLINRRYFLLSLIAEFMALDLFQRKNCVLPKKEKEKTLKFMY